MYIYFAPGLLSFYMQTSGQLLYYITNLPHGERADRRSIISNLKFGFMYTLEQFS